jgi:hypothetical protein
LEVGREEEIEVVVAEVSEVLGGLFVFVFSGKASALAPLIYYVFLQFWTLLDPYFLGIFKGANFAFFWAF